MHLIQTFMNIAVPPIVLILLILFLPIYQVFKLIIFIKRSICSENVAGKVVLITGAASGIGEQLTYEYAGRGALLALVDINENCLVQVSNKAHSIGSPDSISIVADVSKVEDCERFINEAVKHFGRLDHLVNNAGTARFSKFEDTSQISDHHPVMDINFWGTVNGIHYAIPHLKKSKGKIVVISSVCGWYPLPTLSIYNASKAALISFCETLRTELGPSIGITIVKPGLIKTNLTKSQDTLIPVIPEESAEVCAKAIVSGACRGDLYVTEPAWIRWLFPVKMACPEVIDWCNHLYLLMIEHVSVKRKAAKGKTSGGK
ncbi:11-beta-hydroxysteroid dehydrogenase-like 3 [Morus notabilis]|uniref:11-beta-hydroxysteroid dehydrogenase-like 3 n=1 Tax=Morus notabilis TaxID=981085 RepID=UPI000CECEE56|nr:11-beta-hydroxysteroid dehydrogenase-like 3 [Morus notabilis]